MIQNPAILPPGIADAKGSARVTITGNRLLIARKRPAGRFLDWVRRIKGIVVAAFVLLHGFAAIAISPGNLQVEYRTNPLGIDVTQPRLSWTLSSPTRGDRQTAYEVLVASSSNSLTAGIGDLWDSGEATSTQQNGVLYGGSALQTSQQVFWAVRVWDANGNVSQWSAPANWTMGVLNAGDWQGAWIMGPQRKSLGYHAQTSTTQSVTKWVQVDLGTAYPINTVVLHPKWHQDLAGYGFPLRFLVQVSNDPTFATATTVTDQTGADYTNPGYIPVPFTVPANTSARYVRVTATKLYYYSANTDYTFALSQLEVDSGGVNVAHNDSVSALDSIEAYGWGAAGLTDGAGFVGCDYGRRLRKEFVVNPGLQRAVVHVCGLGEYELSLDGAKSGTDILSPGWSAYKTTCLYDTRDITSMLQTGTNAVGLILGNSMYNIGPGYGRYVKFQQNFGPLCAIVQIQLQYSNGSTQVVVSDTSWQTGPGAISFENVYAGEDYDARLEPTGWNQPGFTNPQWTPAVLSACPTATVPSQISSDDGGDSFIVTASGSTGTLHGLSCAAPPIGPYTVFNPVNINTISANTIIYDSGQNAAVMPQLQVSGPAGSYLRIIPGESLTTTGTVDRSSVTQNSNPPLPAWWQYTLAGTGTESWSPKFFYQSSRYWQVQLYPAPGGSVLPAIQSLQSVAVHSTAAPVGSFSCSNPLFNQIYSLVRWAQMNNMMSLFTDCPGRERLGWLEQDHLNGPSLRYDFDVSSLFTKVANDIANSQWSSNGFIPNIAPEYFQTSNSLTDPYHNSPEWGSTFIIGAWQQYQFDGDIGLLQRFYPQMKAYLGFLSSTYTNNIATVDLGDWFDLGQIQTGLQLTTNTLPGTAIYYEDTLDMAQIAQALGYTSDATTYTQLAANIGTAFNSTFYNAATGAYDTSSQAANAMPLALGLVSQSNTGTVTNALLNDVESRGNALTTGEIAFVYLLRALQQAGRADLIYTMNNQANTPGYAYQIATGATSLTERWDGQPMILSGSLDHFMLGHIIEWLYDGLAGIQPDPSAPGFKKIIIKPSVVGDLTSVSGSYNSVLGMVSDQWTINGNELTMNVSIPVGSTATLYVPAGNASSVMESGVSAASSPGVSFLGLANGYASYAVGSGNYSFTSVPGLAAPVILGATATQATATITWSAVPGASGYEVCRASTSGGPYTTIANNITTTSFTDTGLITGSTYYYVISAENSSGSHANSAEAAVTVWLLQDGGFESPPFETYAFNPSGTAWTFTEQSGYNGSGIVHKGSPHFNVSPPEGSQTAFLEGTASISQAMTGLVPGTTYTIIFSAAQRTGYINGGQTWNVTFNGSVIGSYAPGQNATTFNDYTATFTPTATSGTLAFVGTDLNGGDNTVYIDNVRVAAGAVPGLTGIAGNASATLSWQPVANASAYNVKRALSPGGPFVTIASVTGTTYTDTTANNGVAYYYEVSAIVAGSESANTAPVGITPLAAIVSVPNYGFETPALPADGYSYNTTGGFWTFSPASNHSGSGIAANGSAFTSSNPAAPQGTQVAFLEQKGTITQTLSGFAPGGVYTVAFFAANRATSGYNGEQSWNVNISGSTIGSFSNVSTSYANYTAIFIATAAQETLGFVGTGTSDTTVFLDNISITGALPPAVQGISAIPAMSSSQINLLWNASSGATGYIVKRASSISGPFTQLAVTTTLNYTDTTAIPGATYYYAITSLNPVGNGPDSAIFSAATYTAIQNWRYRNFGTTSSAGLAGDTFDPAGDGIVNLLKYATGGFPWVNESATPPDTLGETGGGGNAYLTITFNEVSDPALTYEVLAANQINGAWSPIWSSTGSANLSGPKTVQDNSPISLQPMRFLKLQVSY